MEKNLEYFVENKVATIILKRPKSYNSFNKKLREELITVLDIIEDDPLILVAIIKGSGNGFSAGADLNEPFPLPISKHLDTDYKPIFKKIINSRLLYIAVVHGSAAGIASSLAMSCDFLIMANDAKISLVFSNVGLVPDGGATWLLQKALGYKKALEIIVEGKHLSAKECLNCGLANKVFENEKLHDEALTWAISLSKRAPLVMSAAKKLLRMSSEINYFDSFNEEANFQDIMSTSEDFHNARISFLKKQKPVFKGK